MSVLGVFGAPSPRPSPRPSRAQPKKFGFRQLPDGPAGTAIWQAPEARPGSIIALQRNILQAQVGGRSWSLTGRPARTACGGPAASASCRPQPKPAGAGSVRLHILHRPIWSMHRPIHDGGTGSGARVPQHGVIFGGCITQPHTLCCCLHHLSRAAFQVIPPVGRR